MLRGEYVSAWVTASMGYVGLRCRSPHAGSLVGGAIALGAAGSTGCIAESGVSRMASPVSRGKITHQRAAAAHSPNANNERWPQDVNRRSKYGEAATCAPSLREPEVVPVDLHGCGTRELICGLRARAKTSEK